jgi:Fe-S-cluster containining protein
MLLRKGRPALMAMDALIHPADLHRALQNAGAVFTELQACYGLLAETDCDCCNPGTCCRFLPEMIFAEALQWVDVIRRLPPTRRVATIRRFIEFYATCPLHSGGCPFLEARRCSVYPQRPFACRAYGLWSVQTGRCRTQENRESRNTLIRQWKHYGVELPQEKAQVEMDYCAEVRRRSSEVVSDEGLMEVLAKVYELDRSFWPLSDSFENHYHSDFSFLLAGLLLGHRKAVLGKFAVIKDLVRKQPNGRLEAILSHARVELMFVDLCA